MSIESHPTSSTPQVDPFQVDPSSYQQDSPSPRDTSPPSTYRVVKPDSPSKGTVQ